MTIRTVGFAGILLALTISGCGASTANQGAVSDASGPAAPPAKAEPAKAPPTWGKRYTWPDGLAIEVSAPAACKPGRYAQPQNVRRAVKFTVLVVNGTAKAFETAVLTVGGDAQFNGKKADAVFDSDGGCNGSGGLDTTTILPGKTYSYSVAYSVEPAAGEMQLVFQPDFGADKAVFVGQA